MKRSLTASLQFSRFLKNLPVFLLWKGDNFNESSLKTITSKLLSGKLQGDTPRLPKRACWKAAQYIDSIKSKISSK